MTSPVATRPWSHTSCASVPACCTDVNAGTLAQDFQESCRAVSMRGHRFLIRRTEMAFSDDDGNVSRFDGRPFIVDI